jgi:hypothetical protein
MWKKFIAPHLLDANKIYVAADKQFDHIWFFRNDLQARKQEIIYGKTYFSFIYIDQFTENNPYWIYELLPIDSDLFCSENAQSLLEEHAKQMKVIRERALIFNPIHHEIY